METLETELGCRVEIEGIGDYWSSVWGQPDPEQRFGRRISGDHGCYDSVWIPQHVETNMSQSFFRFGDGAEVPSNSNTHGLLQGGTFWWSCTFCMTCFVNLQALNDNSVFWTYFATLGISLLLKIIGWLESTHISSIWHLKVEIDDSAKFFQQAAEKARYVMDCKTTSWDATYISKIHYDPLVYAGRSCSFRLWFVGICSLPPQRWNECRSRR